MSVEQARVGGATRRAMGKRAYREQVMEDVRTVRTTFDSLPDAWRAKKGDPAWGIESAGDGPMLYEQLDWACNTILTLIVEREWFATRMRIISGLFGVGGFLLGIGLMLLRRG